MFDQNINSTSNFVLISKVETKPTFHFSLEKSTNDTSKATEIK